MVLVEHVSVALDGTPVLHDVSFEIAPGTVAGYVGPNGAGKTTTMRLLTGALAPDTGRVVVGGVDVAQDPLGGQAALRLRARARPRLRELHADRVPRLHRPHARPGRGHRSRARTAAHLRFWGLDGAARQSMTGFSKGMKQKVLLSAAMLHDPAVLLLDEPLSGLDAHAVLQTRALLRTLVARGTTVFYSSHLLDAVEKVADFVVVVRDGRILQTGTPAEITAGAGGASARGRLRPPHGRGRRLRRGRGARRRGVQPARAMRAASDAAATPPASSMPCTSGRTPTARFRRSIVAFATGSGASVEAFRAGAEARITWPEWTVDHPAEAVALDPDRVVWRDGSVATAADPAVQAFVAFLRTPRAASLFAAHGLTR